MTCCSWMSVCAVIGVPALVLVFVKVFLLPKRRRIDLKGKHAFITGGSKGIGKAVAMELVKRGCNVTIAARDSNSLVETCAELNTVCQLHGENRQAIWYSLDVTSNYETIESTIRQAEDRLGPVDILVNNAGKAAQGLFEELPISSFEHQIKLNFISAVNCTRAVVPGMKRRGSGRIAFTCSVAGQMGVWGYTAYAPSKFALRGFAEALQMELEPYNIPVTVLYPPNTETDNYEEEKKTMPEELELIGGAAGLFQPKQVGRLLVEDMIEGNFATTVGTDGWMVGLISAGGAPETNVLRAASQVLLSGLFRFVLFFYHRNFRNIVEKCAQKRSSNKK